MLAQTLIATLLPFFTSLDEKKVENKDQDMEFILEFPPRQPSPQPKATRGTIPPTASNEQPAPARKERAIGQQATSLEHKMEVEEPSPQPKATRAKAPPIASYEPPAPAKDEKTFGGQVTSFERRAEEEEQKMPPVVRAESKAEATEKHEEPDRTLKGLPSGMDLYDDIESPPSEPISFDEGTQFVEGDQSPPPGGLEASPKQLQTGQVVFSRDSRAGEKQRRSWKGPLRGESKKQPGEGDQSPVGVGEENEARLRQRLLKKAKYRIVRKAPQTGTERQIERPESPPRLEDGVGESTKRVSVEESTGVMEGAVEKRSSESREREVEGGDDVFVTAASATLIGVEPETGEQERVVIPMGIAAIESWEKERGERENLHVAH